MKARCTNPNRPKYPRYGGRGIKVCDEWNKDFLCFYNWSISHGYSPELQLDREDNDGNYCPENCRWVTLRENTKNYSYDNCKIIKSIESLLRGDKC